MFKSVTTNQFDLTSKYPTTSQQQNQNHDEDKDHVMNSFNANLGGAMNARTLPLCKVDVLDVNCTARLYSDF